MKLIVNYDLINATKDVNEKMSPLKIIRNRKADYAKFNIPLYLLFALLFLN